MDLAAATAFATEHTRGTIATIGADGLPHLTIVAYAPVEGTLRVSLTDGRVKTTNLRERPRAVLHVHSEDMWRYVSIECDAELSPVTTEPGDITGEELLTVYEAVAGPHPDPVEFHQAMVDDQRLVLRLTPTRAYGQL